MKMNPKSQKGAITLIVLVTMLFLIAFLMSMYIRISNKAQTSAETTEEIAKKYNNIGEANDIYNSYFANSDVIPIYTVEQLKKIGSGEKIEVNGKIYTFTTNGYYTLMNDLDLGGYYDEENETWIGTQWEPLPLSDSNGTQYKFTGTLDGLGHEIKGLYINDEELNNQGLFGILTGTVKNLSIVESYINAKLYIGAIAGRNEGTVKNCINKAEMIGTGNIGGIVGRNYKIVEGCTNEADITGVKEYVGGIVGDNLILSTTNEVPKVINCKNKGQINGTVLLQTGGIIGTNNKGEIYRCYNKGTVLGAGRHCRIFYLR